MDQSSEADDEMMRFERLYNRIACRHLYYVPLILMLGPIVVLGGLVIETAIRSGYERYLLFYQFWLGQEANLGSHLMISHLPPWTPRCFRFQRWHQTCALSAISGAYPFVYPVYAIARNP